MDEKVVRYRATAQDRMQDVSRTICDQLIHVVMRFDNTLDDARLKRAVRLIHEVEPLLACRWTDERVPYWQHKSGAYAIASFMMIECEDPMAEAMQFLTVRASPSADPLMQCHLFRGKYDVVVLKVNHVMCDAHGARHLAYVLAQLYNDQGDTEWSAKVQMTDRGMRPIWKSFPLGQRLRFVRIALKVMRERPSPRGTAWAMPFTSREARDPRMLLKHFDRTRSERIITYGKERKATVNDIFLNAFIRSAHAVIKPKEGVPVPFQVAFDLRQYAPGMGADLANLTSAIYLSFAKDGSRSFEDDLKIVKAEMDRAKVEKRAAVGMPLLKLTYGTRSYSKVKVAFESMFDASVKQRNVRPLLTNLGRLDAERLGFGDVRPSNVFITSPITYPPLLVMGLSGYDGSFTITSGFCAYGIDPALMDRLMDEMDRQLPQ